jgi:Flp pilus assembly protein TadD
VATGLADTRKALDGRPYDAQAWFLLGLRQEAVGQASEAALDVRHALQLEPNYCRALAWASDHAWQQGDRSQARAYYQQVLRAHALVLVEDEMDDLSRAMQVIDPTWVRDRSRRFR